VRHGGHLTSEGELKVRQRKGTKKESLHIVQKKGISYVTGLRTTNIFVLAIGSIHKHSDKTVVVL